MVAVEFESDLYKQEVEKWLRAHSAAKKATLKSDDQGKAAVIAYLEANDMPPDKCEKFIKKVSTCPDCMYVSLTLAGEGGDFQETCQILSKLCELSPYELDES